MKNRDCKKEFCTLMEKFAFSHSKWQVWNDFLNLSAISLANVVPTPEKEEREEKYLSIINSYQEKEQEIFPQLLNLVVMALEENPGQDFLGSLYHHLELHQEQKGQFFTPYHICEFMAEIQFPNKGTDEMMKKKHYISVNDPACGAGAMLIAFANVAKRHGINYQKHVLFVAQDIDRTAAMMCYIQMSLLGCPAVVVIGDSLTKPFPNSDNEAWYTPFYYLNQWRFASKKAEGKQEYSGDITRNGVITVILDDPNENIKLLEGADGQLLMRMMQVS